MINQAIVPAIFLVLFALILFYIFVFRIIQSRVNPVKYGFLEAMAIGAIAPFFGTLGKVVRDYGVIGSTPVNGGQQYVKLLLYQNDGERFHVIVVNVATSWAYAIKITPDIAEELIGVFGS